MRTISTADLAYNLEQILDSVECQGDSVLVTRNNRTIARILPGVARMTALEAMSDLYGIVAEEAAQEWLNDSRIGGTLAEEMRNSWDS